MVGLGSSPTLVVPKGLADRSPEVGRAGFRSGRRTTRPRPNRMRWGDEGSAVGTAPAGRRQARATIPVAVVPVA